MSVTGPLNEARTTIGPLTTVWTPPASCTNYAAKCASLTSSDCTSAWGAQRCLEGFDEFVSVEDATDCWPPASEGASVPSAPFLGWGFYSPGLSCPVGYEPACSATGHLEPTGPYQFSMLSGETAIGCCPSGFECSLAGSAQTCQSIAGSLDSFPLVTCAYSTFLGPNTMTLPYTGTATLSSSVVVSESTYVPGYDFTTTFPTYQLVAPMIELRFQSSDLPVSTSATPTSSLDTPQTDSTKGKNEPKSEGLSTGAKAAIGVCVPVFVLALFAGAVFFWRRRRNRSKPDQPQVAYAYEKPPAHQLQGNPVYEMDDQRRTSELGSKVLSSHERHEMRGSDPNLTYSSGREQSSLQARPDSG